MEQKSGQRSEQKEAYNQFIEFWGSMGVLWGINRSMARIHAYLLLASDPVDLDTVAQQLNISRGNASMCLKELRNWRVIHKINISGDRRDFYVPEADAWKMFFRIAVERKRREFDPTLQALRLLISEANTEKNPQIHQRLIEMENILSSADRIMDKFLSDENKSKSMLGFFKTLI
jgi:DNA-binding transcriptional regulator GbsR (MarR family)